MKNIRSFALGFVLAVGLTLSGVAFAQNTAHQDPNKKHESCCAMESCCCKDGSCSMRHNEKHAKKEGAKQHSHKDGCCCCGDSCNVKMKEKEKQG